jgi:hypothetical protein
LTEERVKEDKEKIKGENKSTSKKELSDYREIKQ